jgi:hypothetical protein
VAKTSLIGWLDKRGNAVQAMAAIAMALIALSALVGVKVQIDAAARVQQEQSARDIYREFLNLSISKPEFAAPDYCAIKDGPQAAAYHNYVEYLLYTSEQILAVAPEWERALSDHLEAHDAYLCGVQDWSDYPDSVRAMISRVKNQVCAKASTACGE